MTNLQVSVLGRLQVRRGETPLNLGSPQQQAMFVVLLMRAGQAATATDLVEALWGADEPASAMTALRTYAWRLRKVLEQDSKNPSTLVSLGDGYRLALDNGDVDFLRAEELANRAERAREAGDFDGAYELLDSALALWQGEPLAAIPGPFAARQRYRLTEARLSLQEKRIEIGLALGHGDRFISQLQGLIDQYPLQERLHALLMQAQHQSGRRADALAAFRHVRQLLVDELGVEPGPELVSLHQRILAGDTGLVDTLTPEAADQPQPSHPATPPQPATNAPSARAGRTGFQSPAQLPPQSADFTGRSHLAVTLCSAMNTPNRGALPVVVLVGMGGVGKSALALHVAHRVRDAYPDGQLYAHLRAGDGEPLRPEGVLVGFLSALGHNPDEIPKGLDALTALFRTTVDRHRILIVLDDAKDAEQVRPLLPGAANCGVLITSRSRLNGLSAGMQAELHAFLPAEALELLARTIGAERVERERAAALELMESCAYLPLAVRIVAARLAARPQWTVQSLARRLADERTRVSQLRAGDMTISAAFDVSYRQLTDDQSAALRRTAGIDSPDLSLACATALLGIEEPDAEDLLESLVDAAMLESPSAGKYRFHSLLRGFARDKASSQEQSDAVSRLLDHLFASSMAAFAQFVSGDPIEDALSPTKVPGAHLATADAARAWAKAEGDCALALVGQIARTVLAGPAPGTQEDESRRQLRICVDLLIALSAFWADTRGSEWVGVVESLTAAAEHCEDLRAQGRTHFLSGNIALAMSQLSLAEEQAGLAVELARRTDDVVILRQALNDLGLTKQLRGEFQEAIALYSEAIALARRLGHTTGEVATTVNSALLHIYAGEPCEAVRICEEILSSGAPESDDGLAYTYYVLGMANHTLGDYERAVVWFERCLSLSVATRQFNREAYTRFRLADSLRELRVFGRALAEATQAAELCEEAADPRNHGLALMVMGNTLLDLGDAPSARESLSKAHALFLRLDLPEAQRTAHLLAAAGQKPVLVPEAAAGGMAGEQR